MFGMMWYRAKVLKIIEKDYVYKVAVPGWQTKIFNETTRHIKQQGGNEYDAAISFMLIQSNSIIDTKAEEAKSFIENIEYISMRLMPLGKLGQKAFNN